jgi:hypothetical protein
MAMLFEILHFNWFVAYSSTSYALIYIFESSLLTEKIKANLCLIENDEVNNHSVF